MLRSVLIVKVWLDHRTQFYKQLYRKKCQNIVSLFMYFVVSNVIESENKTVFMPTNYKRYSVFFKQGKCNITLVFIFIDEEVCYCFLFLAVSCT